MTQRLDYRAASPEGVKTLLAGASYAFNRLDKSLHATPVAVQRHERAAVVN